jgi:branched-chain amino acid transport system ATP-binding protein
LEPDGNLLTVSRLSAFYRQARSLDAVDIALARGTSLAVLGANGAGKTTLLRAISGIMVRREGSVVFNDEELVQLKPHRIVERGISHVPEGKHLFKPLSVAENIEIGALALHRTGRSRETGTARELVYNLFPVLAERRTQSAGTLSGGEQQMLAIGRALMSRPKLLLLDEPTVGLAPRINESLFAALRRLKALGLAIIVAEQAIGLACELADVAIVLHLGRVALAGAAAAVRHNPELKRLYLGG